MNATDRHVQPIPEHLHTVTPRLVVKGAADAIEFYRIAFGAEEIGERFVIPGGLIVHAEVRIGDSIVMLSDDPGEDDSPARSPAHLGGSVSAIMATHWENVDEVWDRAVKAGAEVLYPLEDQFYGERSGRLRDPFGQQWMLSERIEELSAEQIESRSQEL